MAPPPGLPLPSGDSRLATTTGWSLSSPRTQRLLLNIFIATLVLYQLTFIVNISWDVEIDESTLSPRERQQQEEQQRTNWNLPSFNWPKGQPPPPAGPEGILYPGSQYKQEEEESRQQQQQNGAMEHNTPEKEEEEGGDESKNDEEDGVDETRTPSGSQHENSKSGHVLQSSQQLPPRLYDIVLFNDELDLLEVRLNELSNVVDIFVILESEESFQRHPKPLHFRLNERSPRFQPFKDRILHIVVPPMTDADLDRARLVGGQGWEAETYLRSKGLFMALDIFRPSPGDWIMHSDVDEIPRASILERLKADPASLAASADPSNTAPPSFLRLECGLYYYSFEFRHPHGWMGPTLARFEEPPLSTTGDGSSDVDVFSDKDDEAQVDEYGNRLLAKPFWHDWSNAGYRLRMRLRLSGEVPVVRDACWHCSWCFATTDAYRNKAGSYSHAEHSQQTFMQDEWIIDHVREGKDLFDRAGQEYAYVVNNEDLPEYINIHRDRFAYLLDRKGKANAGFTNIDENTIN
ncbi:hypothetical protein DFQ26_007939 [Actinomortierella ambigua]|nr:hypothetical protein DFQ26_007939 [Actinomortierella ambigua]